MTAPPEKPPHKSRARGGRGTAVAAPTTAALARQMLNGAESAREPRVRECIELMRAGKFVRGKTGPDLAARWGLNVNYVEHITAEAWRRFCAEVTNPAERTAEAMTLLDELRDDAMAEAKEPAMIDAGGEKGVYQESPNGARKVAIEAIKVQLAVVAARSSTGLPAAWHRLSLEEKRVHIAEVEERLRLAKEQIAEEEAALSPESATV